MADSIERIADEMKRLAASPQQEPGQPTPADESGADRLDARIDAVADALLDEESEFSDYQNSEELHNIAATLRQKLAAPSGQTLAGAGGELARIVELANHLVASGPKAAHVSASECHEIRDFIVDLTATSAGTTGDDSEDAALPYLSEQMQGFLRVHPFGYSHALGLLNEYARAARRAREVGNG